ncbi:MAG: hypothetical protein ACLR13_07390 [Acutalibacteraceae bacterium]
MSAMYRYDNVIPLSNAVGSELVLGTGADLWVADVQDVFPSIMEVAKCFEQPWLPPAIPEDCPVRNTTDWTMSIPI